MEPGARGEGGGGGTWSQWGLHGARCVALNTRLSIALQIRANVSRLEALAATPPDLVVNALGFNDQVSLGAHAYALAHVSAGGVIFSTGLVFI